MHRIVIDVDDSIYVAFNSFLHILPNQSLRIVADTALAETRTHLNELVETIREKRVFSSVEDGLAWQNEQRYEW